MFVGDTSNTRRSSLVDDRRWRRECLVFILARLPKLVRLAGALVPWSTQSPHAHPFRARTSGGGIAQVEFQLRFGMNLPTKHRPHARAWQTMANPPDAQKNKLCHDRTLIAFCDHGARPRGFGQRSRQRAQFMWARRTGPRAHRQFPPGQIGRRDRNDAAVARVDVGAKHWSNPTRAAGFLGDRRQILFDVVHRKKTHRIEFDDYQAQNLLRRLDALRPT